MDFNSHSPSSVMYCLQVGCTFSSSPNSATNRGLRVQPTTVRRQGSKNQGLETAAHVRSTVRNREQPMPTAAAARLLSPRSQARIPAREQCHQQWPEQLGCQEGLNTPMSLSNMFPPAKLHLGRFYDLLDHATTWGLSIKLMVLWGNMSY